MKPSRLLLVVVALIVGVFAVVGWRRFHAAGATDYRTAVVDRGPIRMLIAATGSLRAVTTVDVGSQLSGQIATVEGDFNQHVTQGQPIAHIDPAVFKARVTQAEADVASAEANLVATRANKVDAEASARNADREYKRRRELRERNLIAITDLDTAQLAAESAAAKVGVLTAQIDVAAAAIRQKRAALDNAKLDLDHTVIRAPVNGVVVQRAVEPGQTVAASFQTPVLFQIAEDLTQMQLNLAIDEADVGQVREGLPVRFNVDAFPGREFSGKVAQIRLAATTTQNVVTYPVVVAVDNADLALLPGMTANAEIDIGGNPDALRVPNAALRFRLAGAGAPASNGGPRQGGMDWDGLKSKLKLSAEQASAFDAAVAAMRQKMQAQRQARQTGDGAGGPPAGGPPGDTGGGRGEGSGGRGGNRFGQAMKEALAPFRATLDDAQKAILDAELASLGGGKRGSVYVLRDGSPVAVAIRIGATDSERTEVIGDALKPGDAVIVGSSTPAR